jgi:imidazoleglycerol-phosphate dehydratase
MSDMGRDAVIDRTTKETAITVRLDLDGSGVTDVATGVPFLNHMLDALGRHAWLDISLSAKGDLAVDAHHTVEDCGICVGAAIAEALGDRAGIRRFGSAAVPLDEALVLAAVDVSGRGSLTYDVDVPIELIGTFDTTLAREFFAAVAVNAGMTVHLHLVSGDNAHHIIEAAFKAFAVALREAVAIDPRVGGAVPSTKGML